MKDINFKKIVIQDFMSIGSPIEISFDVGLNFLTGYNVDSGTYNGVGKTTIINAFFFALFGTLYGDNSGKLKKADIVNNIKGGTPLVTLFFEVDGVEYEVLRSVSPSRCVLTIDGDDSNQEAGLAQTNAKICKIISGDSEVYSNTVVLDSDTSSFLLKKPEQKRKFIESVFGMSVFSDMLKLVKTDYTTKNKEFVAEQTKLDEIKRFKVEAQRSADEWGIKQTAKISEVDRRIDQFILDKTELEHKSTTDKSDKITELEDRLELNSGRILKAESVKLETQNKVNNIKAEIERVKKTLISPDTLMCHACKRPFVDHSQEDIDAENVKINGTISELSENLLSAEESHSKVLMGITGLTRMVDRDKTELRNVKAVQAEFLNLETQISDIDRKIVALKDKIKEIEGEENPFEASINTRDDEINTKTDLVSDLEEEVEVLDYVKYLCSPEGVKAHILAKIVELFNAKLNYYLNILTTPFTIKFDQYFEETITNENGAEVSYHSLSGGERKRVDLSMLFAFKDIRRMQSNINVNVTMFDEILDSAICSVGINKSLDILQEHSDENDESIFIITHKLNQVDDRGEVIYLEKVDGLTKRVDEANYRG